MNNSVRIVKNSLLALAAISIGLLFTGCETSGDHRQQDSGGYNHEMHMEEQSERGVSLEPQTTEHFADVPAVFTENPDEMFAELRAQPDFTKMDVVAAPMMSSRQ